MKKLNSMKITKKVTFFAKKDKIKELKKLLETMITASKNEFWCLFYDIFQSQENKQKFIVIESWENENALKWHQKSKHYKFYKENYEEFCESKNSEVLGVLES